jgi:hypothetical protein
MLFGKKKASRVLSSSSSQSPHTSETGSIHKHTQKPSITIEETISPALEPIDEPVVVGALPYAQASLHAPNVQSRQSLSSHRSKGSLSSNLISSNNE